MKTLVVFLLASVISFAASIIITVKNDAGQTITTTVIQTNDAMLTAANQWRLSQVISHETTDAGGKIVPAALQFPTIDSLWRHIVIGFFRENVIDLMPNIQLEYMKINTANAEIKRLKTETIK